MNKSQALKEAKRRYGPDAVILDHGAKRASTPEERAIAHAKMREMNELSHEEKKARRKERDHYFSEAFKFRYAIGEHHGFCVMVMGTGDSWAEALAEAEKRYPYKTRRWVRGLPEAA